jgi:hypothetical protein
VYFVVRIFCAFNFFALLSSISAVASASLVSISVSGTKYVSLYSVNPDKYDVVDPKVISSGSSYYNKSRPTSASSGYRSSSFSSRGSKVYPDTLKHSNSRCGQTNIKYQCKETVPNLTLHIDKTI